MNIYIYIFFILIFSFGFSCQSICGNYLKLFQCCFKVSQLGSKVIMGKSSCLGLF